MGEIRDNVIQDCCGCETPKPVEKPNNCPEGCCCPKEVSPLDINTAKGIPVLSDRIYDCVRLEDKQRKYLKNLIFTITTPGPYKQGDEICIEKIIVKYRCIGLLDEEIPVRIDSLENDVMFSASNESESCKCDIEIDGTTEKRKLYNVYKGSKVIDIECCEGIGRKTIIGEDCLKFYICKAKLIVKGKIGCEEFRAETPEFSGSLECGFGFKDADFFGTICLPSGRNRVKFEETFDACFSVDCIRAIQPYEDPAEGEAKTFNADAFSTLVITKKIYATVKEELIVFTNTIPGAITCTNGRIDSNCSRG